MEAYLDFLLDYLIKNATDLCTKTDVFEELESINSRSHDEFEQVLKKIPDCPVEKEISKCTDEAMKIFNACSAYITNQNKQPVKWLLDKCQLYRDVIGIIRKNANSLIKDQTIDKSNIQVLILYILKFLFISDEAIAYKKNSTGENTEVSKILRLLKKDIKGREVLYTFLFKLSNERITSSELKKFKKCLGVNIKNIDSRISSDELESAINWALTDVIIRLNREVQAKYYYTSSFGNYTRNYIKHDRDLLVSDEILLGEKDVSGVLDFLISRSKAHSNELNDDILIKFESINPERFWEGLKEILLLEGTSKNIDYQVDVLKTYFEIKLNKSGGDEEVAEIISLKYEKITRAGITRIRNRITEKLQRYMKKNPKTFQVIINKSYSNE